MDEVRLILRDELTLADVPSVDAEFVALEYFCLTVDGYEGGRYSIDDLLEAADKVERGGLENATLDELRSAAFIRQRAYRWSTDQGQDDPPLARKIRDLVDEIRRRVA